MMARYDALVKKVELLKHKANGKRLNKWLTGHEVCQQPVSYTHLDVYKRQTIYSSVMAMVFMLHFAEYSSMLSE